MQRDFTCIFARQERCQTVGAPIFLLQLFPFFLQLAQAPQRFLCRKSRLLQLPDGLGGLGGGLLRLRLPFLLGIEIRLFLTRQFPLQAADLLVGARYGGIVGLYGVFQGFHPLWGKQEGGIVLRLLFKAGFLQCLLQPLCCGAFRCLCLPVRLCSTVAYGVCRCRVPLRCVCTLFDFTHCIGVFLCLRTHLRQPLIDRRQFPQLAQLVQHLALCGCLCLLLAAQGGDSFVGLGKVLPRLFALFPALLEPFLRAFQHVRRFARPL